MRVDLSPLANRSFRVRPQRFGVILGSSGASLQIDRLGDRWAADIETAARYWEPHGRRWSALLHKARRLGGSYPVEQPGFKPGAPGAPVAAAAVASGRLIAVTGLTPNYAVRPGQWLNIVSGGVRYLDQAAEQVIASGTGSATIELQNLLRAPVSAGDLIDLARPTIDGLVEGDVPLDYPLDRTAVFSFSIVEPK